MRRRTLLRTSGIALAGVVGGTATSGLAAAGDADPRPRHKEGRLPNDNVETQQVDPLVGPGQFHEAPAGTWIKHSFGWSGNDCGNLTEVVENTRDVVHIDGERIEDTQRFWNACDPDPAGPFSAFLEWTYYTPPKPPGTHDFSWKIVFTDDAGSFEEGTVFGPFSEPYEVVTRRGGGGGASAAGGVAVPGSTGTGGETADGGPRPV